MSITIYCSMGGHRGRPIEVGPDDPVRIRVRSSEVGQGMLTFRNEDGHCRFLYEGNAEALFNGTAVTTGTMGDNDRLEVGRMCFQVQLATTPIFAVGGQPSAPGDTQDGHKTDELPVTPGDAKGREQDETKAHLEVHTDRYRAQTSRLKVESSDALREQTATVPIPGWAVHVDGEEQVDTVSMPNRPVPGDGRRGGDEDVESGERERRVRRISASQDSVVSLTQEKQGKGILKKMANMFKRTDQQAGRLRDLLEEREGLFREAGRLSLAADGGMGLPESFVQRLLKGDSVTLTAADCNQVVLHRFAERCKLLRMLEAEIFALRDEMGMSIPEQDLPGDEILRTEHQDFEDRAFQASDIVLTQDLGEMGEDPSQTDSYASGELPQGRKPAAAKDADGDAESAEDESDPDKDVPGEARASGRRRSMRRRRRR